MTPKGAVAEVGGVMKSDEGPRPTGRSTGAAKPKSLWLTLSGSSLVISPKILAKLLYEV
jgi:hypothetical protein